MNMISVPVNHSTILIYCNQAVAIPIEGQTNDGAFSLTKACRLQQTLHHIINVNAVRTVTHGRSQLPNQRRVVNQRC